MLLLSKKFWCCLRKQHQPKVSQWTCLNIMYKFINSITCQAVASQGKVRQHLMPFLGFMLRLNEILLFLEIIQFTCTLCIFILNFVLMSCFSTSFYTMKALWLVKANCYSCRIMFTYYGILTLNLSLHWMAGTTALRAVIAI